MQKPSLPPGTRDFGPQEMLKRNHIIDVIRKVFEKYGFQPLETPAFENLNTLTGKYGDEGDQLLFKILNSGDFLSKVTEEEIQGGYKKVLPKISKKGLRYDLTVPFARYVVQNQHEITFPFRRYQIQPVWRADRPQKGRYREFYQCDADIIGTQSLLCEAEALQMVHEVLHELNFKKFTVHLNHRKLLQGIAEALGEPTQIQALCVAIDKLDKIGEDKVFEQLERKGFSATACSQLKEVFSIHGTNEEKLEQLSTFLKDTPTGPTGIQEVSQILKNTSLLSQGETNLVISPTLARGLTYYTGAIFEVTADEVAIGSIAAGGRYDNLTDIFGLPGLSGMGFSFGLDRIYLAMESLESFPPLLQQSSVKVMLANFEEECQEKLLEVVAQLRAQGISSIIYPDGVKLKKQLAYAAKTQIPYVIIIGEEECKNNIYLLKNMATGEQIKCDPTELLEKLR